MGQRRNALTPERSAAHQWGWEPRARRDRTGLSLAGLGRLVTYDPGYLGRLERGEQFPSENAARACDTALGAGGELARLRAEADAERRQAARATATLPETGAAGSLPPFDEHATCAKCGCSVVSVAYHAAPASGFPCASSPGEHLCRTCERCGYAWREATIAARPGHHPRVRLVDLARAGA